VTPRRAVFLDRDGVLNEPIVRGGKPYPPESVETMTISPGAPESLARLRELGFVLIVVSNQPDVARGSCNVTVVERVNAALAATMPIDDFLMCYHDDRDACDCRKPKPGLLLQGAARHGIDLRKSYMVGDRWRDIDAGHAAGCVTIWIDRGYDERKPAASPAARVHSIVEAAHWIASRPQADRPERP
jgi:D-glycero-D-manno-heptose 1,7-bisphosphate phosphatase